MLLLSKEKSITLLYLFFFNDLKEVRESFVLRPFRPN
jgi:hypothetical protein